jgi:hypothetical protein
MLVSSRAWIVTCLQQCKISVQLVGDRADGLWELGGVEHIAAHQGWGGQAGVQACGKGGDNIHHLMHHAAEAEARENFPTHKGTCLVLAAAEADVHMAKTAATSRLGKLRSERLPPRQRKQPVTLDLAVARAVRSPLGNTKLKAKARNTTAAVFFLGPNSFSQRVMVGRM